MFIRNADLITILIPKFNIKKVSGNNKSKDLDIFNVDPKAKSAARVKKKTTSNKNKKKVQKTKEEIKPIWNTAPNNYPKIGSKGAFKRKDGVSVDLEVTAHGRTGFTGIYKDAAGEYRMAFVKEGLKSKSVKAAKKLKPTKVAKPAIKK